MAMLVSTLESAAQLILSNQSHSNPTEAYLVGISGIDASGKGYISRILGDLLNRAGKNTAVINIDGWLNLPGKRFSDRDSAHHFYEHAIRFDELLSTFVLPLKRNRSIELTMDFTEETACAYRKHHYFFHDVAIMLVEGIYLFKTQYRPFFDLTIWVDCTFETALRRAIYRAQEGLLPEATAELYKRIYFPAQQIHFDLDQPRDRVDIILENKFE